MSSHDLHMTVRAKVTDTTNCGSDLLECNHTGSGPKKTSAVT
jgi:hypothetical protein